MELVIRVKKIVELSLPHLNYLGVFLRFRRTFTEVTTFVCVYSRTSTSVCAVGPLLVCIVGPLLVCTVGPLLVCVQ